ncbi:MAG: peptidylprolyl isomerase [Bacteroidota bacterium]
MMKFVLFLAQIGIVSIALAQPITLDKVVAQVGDNVILLSDIQEQRLQAQDAKVTVDSSFDCRVLEQIMVTQILVNQAKLDSVVISDEQVDADMENRLRLIQNQMGGRQKLEEFYRMSYGEIKDKFREIIRTNMLADEMKNTITMGLGVTPKEVKSFFESLPADSIPFINMQLGFQQIVIYPEITKEDKKLAMDKIKELRDMVVVQKKSFESIARTYSMDPGSAPMGGKIAATKGMMVPQFEATVFKLKPAEISEPIETEFGYHIIKLISRSGDDFVCLHILIRPEFSIQTMNKASQRMDSCYRMLKMNELTWEQAVARYSNDASTRQNKGIISNPRTASQLWDMEDLNEIDQQIYLLTDAMEAGDITQPNLYMDFMTRQQGIRIVRLMQRFPAHRANLNDDYTLIKQAAENDKRARILTEWVDGKIGNAYIRIDQDFVDCDFQHKWINRYNNE